MEKLLNQKEKCVKKDILQEKAYTVNNKNINLEEKDNIFDEKDVILVINDKMNNLDLNEWEFIKKL